MHDVVNIHRLLISTHIGVPDEERSEPQELCVSVKMEPRVGFEELEDEIENGVDYYQVGEQIKHLAAIKPRKLIETLAVDIAQMILTEFSVLAVKVDIEKYILTDADYVGVSIYRKNTLLL